MEELEDALAGLRAEKRDSVADPELARPRLERFPFGALARDHELDSSCAGNRFERATK